MKEEGLFDSRMVQGSRRNPAREYIYLAPDWTFQLEAMKESSQKNTARLAVEVFVAYGGPMYKGGLRNLIAWYKNLDDKKRHCLSSDLTRLCDSGFLVQVNP